MAPTYRLYPQQAANGRRSLRALETGNDTGNPLTHGHSMSEGIGVATGSHVDFQYHSDVSGRPSAEDEQTYPSTRQDSLPAEPSALLNMDMDTSGRVPISPVASDYDERYDSAAGSRDRSLRVEPKYSTNRYLYDRDNTYKDPKFVDNSQGRSRSRTSNATPRPSSHTRGPPTSRRPSDAGRQRYNSRTTSPERTPENEYGANDRSSAESIMSEETAATSISTLPALQSKGPDNSDAQQLEPVLEDDPRSWDLVEPASNDAPTGLYALEKRADLLFSSSHLHTIFNDPKLLLKFTGFLNGHRPKSIAVLIYYLDALKAIRAIEYANAIAEALEPIQGQKFTLLPAAPTKNRALEEKAEAAFDLLVQEDLPAFITHTWIQVVSISIQRRITGTLAPHLREASEGLAEVFCLTDPSRIDNPIVFASEEFVRTTQYGMGYVIGRNCRFLQGPKTSPHSVRRLAIANTEGRQHCEVFVNYRRDGSPFMNLLMTAPLMDSRGNIRYYIGAQVDVSNLVKECSNLDGLWQLVERDENGEAGAEEETSNKKDEFQELTEMFNSAELETVRKHGGRMHKEYVDDSDQESVSGGGKKRVIIKDNSAATEVTEERGSRSNPETSPAIRERINGRLEGVYQNYLLIRPAPSLRILFTSPSLRVPGILQSPFLDRIGGSNRVRQDLRAALGEGRGVTAKIRWLTRADSDGEGEGRPRWIHCTPLLGHSGAVGVWMIVLVDEESSAGSTSGRRFRPAPPVSNNIGGKDWHAQTSRDKRQNHYDADSERRGGHHLRPDAERPGVGRYNSNMTDRSAPGGMHSNQQYGVTSGDVSEFSFQLK